MSKEHMEGMQVLSLFDGMSCARIALEESGIPVRRYVAYEIDKFAIKSATHNFPDIEEKGDVFDADFSTYQGFDLLIGGSPCTYWSIARKEGRETTASGFGWELFRQYLRALHEARPRFFIYENNATMSKAIRDSIREAFGFDEVMIDSALVSCQTRKRFYWVGIRDDSTGWYRQVPVNQPEDCHIMLKDCLDYGPSLSEREVEYLCRETSKGRTHLDFSMHNVADNEKAHCMTANFARGIPYNVCLERIPPYGDNTKARPLNANYSNNCGGWAKRVFSPNPKKQQMDIIAVSGGTHEVKDGLLDLNGVKHPVPLADGMWGFRKLSVKECKALQTVPDWYEFPVSDTQAFRQLGNGFTISVMMHLIGSCLEALP